VSDKPVSDDHDIGMFVEALCSCGGAGPNDANACDACRMYHAAKAARRDLRDAREALASGLTVEITVRAVHGDVGCWDEQIIKWAADSDFPEAGATGGANRDQAVNAVKAAVLRVLGTWETLPDVVRFTITPPPAAGEKR
jgi:hypothetical protein